ncbi:MAG: hypothetical protein BMS9Abin02_0622 [Anaerolineae bacterium]|nr:MAG: hypothetical protein BMS9Abin02_0622 [Anaerolineae bacterium]
MAENAFQLVVRKGPRTGQIFLLSEDSIKLGRDPSSDIIINDAEVSRHHARLTWKEGGYWLQDMGSTNGSFVGGKRLGGEPLLLEPGQVIMFGTNVTLVYQVTTDVDPMATVIAPAGMLPVDDSAEAPAEPAYAIETDDELDVDDIIFEEPEDELAPEPLLDEADVVGDLVFDSIAEGAVADDVVSEEPFIDEMDLEEITFDDETAFEDEVAPGEAGADEEPVFDEIEDEEEEFAAVLDAPVETPAEEVIEVEPFVKEISFDELIFEEPEVEEPSVPEAAFKPISDGPAVEEPTFDEPAYEEPIFDEPISDGPISDEPISDGPISDEPISDGPAAEEAALDEADFFEAIDEMEEPGDLATVLDVSDSIPTFEPDAEQAPEVEPTPFPSFEPAEQEPAPEPELGPVPSLEPVKVESEPLYHELPVEPAVTPELEPEAAFKPPLKAEERIDSGEPILDEQIGEPAQVAVPPSSPPPVEEAKKSSGNQRIIIAVVVVLLLCCCLIIAAIVISSAAGVFGTIFLPISQFFAAPFPALWF